MALASLSLALPRPMDWLSALPERTKRRLLLAAVGLGAISMGYYYSWWLEPARGFNLLLGPLLVLAVLYNLAQVFGAWYIYTRVAQPQPRRAPTGLRVDVFVPVYDEDATLVERSLPRQSRFATRIGLCCLTMRSATPTANSPENWVSCTSAATAMNMPKPAT